MPLHLVNNFLDAKLVLIKDHELDRHVSDRLIGLSDCFLGFNFLLLLLV